jgi:hypothetical protein
MARLVVMSRQRQNSTSVRTMRIAQIAPLVESVPPRLYGGTERVVAYLSEELVALGHDVTLFASGDSITNASLVPCTTVALRLDKRTHDPVPHYMMMLDRVAHKAAEFDILHFTSTTSTFLSYEPSRRQA